MARTRKPKDPFDGLSNEFRGEIDGSKVEEINAKIVALTVEETQNQEAKKNDPDLKEAKERVKYASEGYKDATKEYKRKMKYIISVLEGRGKA